MIGDLVLALLLLGGCSLFLFVKSTQKDRQDARAREAQRREDAAAAREEACKQEAGTGLVCLGCGLHFTGPLEDTGCPQCHLSSLVVTETQFRETQKRSE